MKKVFCLLILLSVILSSPAPAEVAPEEFTFGSYAYVLLDDGTAEIVKYKGVAGMLEIPSELDHHAVSRIGNEAFLYCADLTSIAIPDSVTRIGDSAFAGCYGLTSLKIPDSVTELGTNPFVGCRSLTSIDVSPDHPTLATIDGVLFERAERRLVCYPCAFTQDTYSILQGIAYIGESAFSDCDSLTTVTIANSVTTIGGSAFYGCDNLTSVVIPDSVTAIGTHAFSSCVNLRSVTIPDSVTHIGVATFAHCPNLTLTVGRDSYAKEYCIENGLKYNYPDSNDWLNG